WNTPWLPQGVNTDNWEYEIWTDYPDNVWHVMTTVDFGSTYYLKNVFNCTPDSMNFRIRLLTSNGCEYVSNIAGDYFRDSVFPNSGIVSSVSVDAEGHAVLEWQESESLDVLGYMIYRCVGSTTIPIFQVNSEPWLFTDYFAETTNGPVSYSIAAYDACANYDTTVCNSSHFLQVENYQVCEETIEMDWTPYESWQFDASFYIVYGGFDEANTYADVSMSPIDTVTSLSYSFSQIQFGAYNVFRIEAVDTLTGFRAFSNFDDTYVADFSVPEFVEIRYASVLNADSVEILVGMEPTIQTFRYELQRLEIATQTWEEALVKDANATPEIIFVDDGRATDVFSYSYRVLIYNSCGLIVDTTNIASTILLDGQSSQERLVNTLAWTPYGDWVDGVDRYEIYRKMKGGEYELLQEVNGAASLFYEDDVSELVDTDGDFYYRIQAVERSADGNEPSISISNELNLPVEAIVWIPNAIVIGGYNNLFKPMVSFALVEEYYLGIFSRWGDLIFETRDLNEGWDGSMNGQFVAEGTYNYYMAVKDGRGRAIDNFGYVVVLNYE
ncbi:MAG: gliding motility-associated C-terminal domain-containing protein, partial [Flavobacteriales bacterium]